MNTLTKDQIRVVLYHHFNKQYFENPQNKDHLWQLNVKERASFYTEQNQFVEEQFNKFRENIEKMTRHCKNVTDQFCNELVSASINEIKRMDNIVGQKNYFGEICQVCQEKSKK